MWGQLVIDSLRRPRAAARRILAAQVPAAQLVEAAVMVSCAGMVLGYVAFVLLGEGSAFVAAVVFDAPLIGAVVQFVALCFVVLLVVRIGRLFGGKGDIPGSAALMIWLDAMMLLIQGLQIVLLLLIPPLVPLLSLVAIVWMFWAFASFVAELHGFQNPAIVLGVAILSAIVLSFGAALLATLVGITPQEVGR